MNGQLVTSEMNWERSVYASTRIRIYIIYPSAFQQEDQQSFKKKKLSYYRFGYKN